MPHQCTECARTFPDGSKEMLSGCPDCGGNKFQFKPADAVDVGAESAAAGGGAPGSTGGDDGGGGAMSRAKATVRDLMGRGDDEGASSDPTAESTAASASDVAGDQTSISEFATSSESTAEAAADSTESAGDATGSGTGGTPNVTPSGSGEWPKSATEEYDTPAEKARRREDSGRDGRAESSDGDAAGSATAADASVEAGSASPGSVKAGSASSGSAEAGSSPAASSEASAAREGDGEGGISAQMGETEDDAQRSARSDVVSPDELPNHGSSQSSTSVRDDEQSERADRAPSRGDAADPGRGDDGTVASEPDGDSPNLDQLREELNSQFESIKVLNPGKYELNLMELYDREEYIISLQEDGRYVIEVPESWRGDPKQN